MKTNDNVESPNMPIELEMFLKELCEKHPKKNELTLYLETIHDQKHIHDSQQNNWDNTIEIKDKKELTNYKKYLDTAEDSQEVIKFLLKNLRKDKRSTYASLILQDYFLLPLPIEECFHWLRHSQKTLPEPVFYSITIPLVIRLKNAMSETAYFDYIKGYFQSKPIKEYLPWLLVSLPKALMTKPKARPISKQINFLHRIETQNINEILQSKIFFVLLLKEYSLSTNNFLTKSQIETFCFYFLDSDLNIHAQSFLSELKKWNIENHAIFSLAPTDINLYLMEFILDQTLLTINPTQNPTCPSTDSIKTNWNTWLQTPSLDQNFQALQNFCQKNQLDFDTLTKALNTTPDLENHPKLIALKIIINHQYTQK